MDYHDTGCIPLDSPECMGSYSGSFNGGSMSFFAFEENGTGSGLPSISFTGVITSGGFSGEYQDLNNPDNAALDNTQAFDFTSSTCQYFNASGQTFNCSAAGSVSLMGGFNGGGGSAFGFLTMTTTVVAPEPPELAGLLIAVVAVARRRLWVQRVR